MMTILKEEELRKLGQNIKRLRKAKGLNQTNLAKSAQTRPTTISSIENGANLNPGWDLLGRVAAVLGTNIHQLTQPELDLNSSEKTKLSPGLTDLIRRQKELLGLGEARISTKELDWLAVVPLDDPRSMSADKYLIILRHYRLVSKA
jgi:transcriptional regulator with XRE-family HTH domain